MVSGDPKFSHHPPLLTLPDTSLNSQQRQRKYVSIYMERLLVLAGLTLHPRIQEQIESLPHGGQPFPWRERGHCSTQVLRRASKRNYTDGSRKDPNNSF